MQFTMEVPFLAPVDVGAELMWYRFEEKSGWGKLQAQVLVDLKGGAVYGNTHLASALSAALERRIANPDVVQMFAALDYVVLEQRRARCVRAFVLTRSQGTHNSGSTVLLCEAVPDR